VKPGLHWYTPELTFNVEFFGTHGPPFGPEHHASHMQSVMLPLPADEFELSGQAVQFAVPFVALYVPGRQALHWPLEAPVSGPVYPVLHEQSIVEIFCGLLFRAQQSVEFTVPERDLYPAGHALHDRAAVTFENESAAHRRHGEESGVGLNEPCGHEVHSEPFMPLGAYPALQVLHDTASEL